ncbi:hypothetical protein MMPV_005941, partial [Pyropia vietnamensis]
MVLSSMTSVAPAAADALWRRYVALGPRCHPHPQPLFFGAGDGIGGSDGSPKLGSLGAVKSGVPTREPGELLGGCAYLALTLKRVREVIAVVRQPERPVTPSVQPPLTPLPRALPPLALWQRLPLARKHHHLRRTERPPSAAVGDMPLSHDGGQPVVAHPPSPPTRGRPSPFLRAYGVSQLSFFSACAWRRAYATALTAAPLGHLRLLYAHTGCVNDVAYAPGSGRLLASASDDRRVLLWRSAGGGVPPAATAPPAPGGIGGWRPAPGGGGGGAGTAPSTSGYTGAGVVTTPVRSPTVVAALASHHAAIVFRVAWEGGGGDGGGGGGSGSGPPLAGSRLLSCGEDGLVVRWDVMTCTAVAVVTPTASAAPVYCVTPSPDDGGAIAAIAAADGSVRLLDWRVPVRSNGSGTQCLVPPSAAAGEAVGAAFVPAAAGAVAGSGVVVAHAAGELALRDARMPGIREREVRVYDIGTAGGVTGVRFAPSGDRFVVARRRGGGSAGSVALYAPARSAPVATYEAPGFCHALTNKAAVVGGHADGLVACGSDDGRVYVWARGRAEVRGRFGGGGRGEMWAHTALVGDGGDTTDSESDEERGAGGGGFGASGGGGPMRYWCRPSPESAAPASFPSRSPAVAASPAEHHSTAVQVLGGARSVVNAVAFHPSGDGMASSGVEKVVRLWRVRPPPRARGALGSGSGSNGSGGGGRNGPSRGISTAPRAVPVVPRPSVADDQAGLAESPETLRMFAYPWAWAGDGSDDEAVSDDSDDGDTDDETDDDTEYDVDSGEGDPTDGRDAEEEPRGLRGGTGEEGSADEYTD